MQFNLSDREQALPKPLEPYIRAKLAGTPLYISGKEMSYLAGREHPHTSSNAVAGNLAEIVDCEFRTRQVALGIDYIAQQRQCHWSIADAALSNRRTDRRVSLARRNGATLTACCI